MQLFLFSKILSRGYFTMSMIRIENLTFSYPSSYDAIFDHTSFQIDTDWKLGF
ncbi:hypothetical protein CLONEX_04101 [[Clostridium] nexile DSM 1787]|nr:hypothetical protein CLONEX_04101 [[Clostridium] nexile DSM 1787]